MRIPSYLKISFFVIIFFLGFWSVSNAQTAEDSGTLIYTDVSNVSRTNNTSEATLYTFTLPALSLTSNNILVLKADFSSIRYFTSANLTFRVKAGATTLLTCTASNSHSGIAQGTLEFRIVANGLTAQENICIYSSSLSGAYQNGLIVNGSSSFDFTNDSTITITAQWGSSGNGETFTFDRGFAYLHYPVLALPVSGGGGGTATTTLELPDDFYNGMALFSAFLVFLFWFSFTSWALKRKM